MNRIVAASVLLAITTGCSTYSALRYSPSTDNVVAIRALSGKMINVGPFTAVTPGQSEIMCRAVGPIKTPDGEPFSEYVRKAFLDDLRIANAFSDSSKTTLSGNLDAIDLSSTDGEWRLSLTVRSTNGKSISVAESFKYKTSWYGETACNQSAQALMPAVQNLVGRVVRSAEFTTLLN